LVNEFIVYFNYNYTGFPQFTSWTPSWELNPHCSHCPFRLVCSRTSASLFCIQLSDSVFTLLACSLQNFSDLLTESESYVTTDGQSASLSWKAPIWGLRPDIYYRRTFVGLLMWGAPVDERTGLSFTIAAGPRQCSHSLVGVPENSWPYYCLRFETSLFVASYDSQGHGGGIRPRLHTDWTITLLTESSVRCYLPWSDSLEDTFSKGCVSRFRYNGLQCTD
jgi:hypothetical protein